MTLVYNRPLAAAGSAPTGDELSSDTPLMHALIIGIGRFPNLPAERDADRQACADSARTMIDFLMQQAEAENFQVPLASVECLISDPSTASGSSDSLPKCHAARDPRPDENIDPGTLPNIDAACDSWLTRCRPANPASEFEGDHLLLYVCSHGVAGRDEGALAVLEDVTPVGFKRWSQLLNIGSIARHVPAASGAGAVWVFLDSCQEVLKELKDMVDGNIAHEPARANITQLASCKVTSLALAGSNFGDVAHAPANGGTAYFTQALIEGLSSCCVERTPQGWFSTAKEIPSGVVRVAQAAFGTPVHTEILKAPAYDLPFLKVSTPQIPIGVISHPTGILRTATKAAIFNSDTGAELFARAPGDNEEAWRLRVSPGFDNLDIQISSPVRPAPFTANVIAMPPAQWVKVSDDE